MNVAVVGATGAVGKQLLSILQERKFPVTGLLPFASERSAGKPVALNGKTYPCRVLKPGCFDGVDFVFFDAADSISKEWVPHALASGAWVIDNSSVFRMDEDVPLLVPEVNGDILKTPLKKKLIAGPNCSTVQMVVALKPIQENWGLKRVVVSTYQSTSGAGAAAMDELTEQTAGVFSQKKVPPKLFKHQIAFNCIPQIGGFKDSGYTSEEEKIVEETRKILRAPRLPVSATAVRVPTLSCHGESVNVECERRFELEEVRKALHGQEGVILQDNPENFVYPMGLSGEDSAVAGATGKDAVYVGRVRRDPSVENGLNLWVVSDNLRKGAALNAVQIGEILLSQTRA
jgi:aspartate-semialdehyde dehydrogenase